jgi:hypothetical protein
VASTGRAGASSASTPTVRCRWADDLSGGGHRRANTPRGFLPVVCAAVRLHAIGIALIGTDRALGLVPSFACVRILADGYAAGDLDWVDDDRDLDDQLIELSSFLLRRCRSALEYKCPRWTDACGR